MARHLQAKGRPTSVAIATAVSQVKKVCATGRTFGGKTKVKASTRAKYCKAAAEWQALKAKNKAKNLKESTDATAEMLRLVEAATPTELSPSEVAELGELARLELAEAETPEGAQEALALAEGCGITITPNAYGILGLQEAVQVEKAPPGDKTDKTAKLALKPGDSGDMPRHLQARLNALGHKLTVDGEFGDKTGEAVRRFRRENGLADAPDVDDPTVEALRSARPAEGVLRRVPGEAPLQRIRGMQEDLTGRGYDVGEAGADGVFGRETERAVKRFQRDHGLRQDGVVGRHTQRLFTLEEAELQEAKLQAKERKQLPKSSFAIPEKRAYPIHDEKHARNALSRVAQHGTSEEKKRVRAAVKRRYPNIGGG